MEKKGWQQSWVRILLTLLTAGSMIMIFCFSMQDANDSDRTSGIVTRAVIRVLYQDYADKPLNEQQQIYNEIQHIIRKCAHFSEYLLLGFLLRLCLESWFGDRVRGPWTLMLITWMAGAGYACTDELHQLLIDGRSGQWTDVLIDFCGVVTGSVPAELITRRIPEKKHRRNRDAGHPNHTAEESHGIFSEK